MKITVNRKSGMYHMEGMNSKNLTAYTDASKKIGGTELAPNPMEMVLMAFGSCSSIDIIYLLNKQKQQLDDIKIEIEADRREKLPKVYTKIHIHFNLYGNISEKKATRAVRISVEDLCSVGEMLKSTATITHSFTIINE